MLLPSGTLYFAFITEDSTGAPTAPTGTPTGVLWKNGSSTGTTVTVTMSTAEGVASAVIPSNAVQGDVFYIVITATVSGATCKTASVPQTIWAANVPANVTQISGDSTAADNLETACDGGSFNIGGGGVVAASVTAGVTLAATTHTGAVIPTVTNLTNLPSIPAGWLTAAGIAAAALDGKGDWLTSEVVGEGGSGLTSLPWNAAWDAEVQRECTDAIVAAGLPRSGVTLRYTQVAANSGAHTADVSIGAAT